MKKNLWLLCAAAALIVNCGDSATTTTPTTGGGTGDPVTDTSTLVSDTLSQSLTTGLSQLGTVSALTKGGVSFVTDDITETTTDCTESGTVTVGGSYTFEEDLFDFDIDMSFDDCDGIDGALSFALSATFTDSSNYDFDFVFDGSVEGYGCSLTYDVFTYAVSVTDDTTGTATIDGTIEATCDEGSVTCTFDNTTFDDSAFDDNCVES